MHAVGYLRGPRPAWLDCDRPLRAVCRDCDHETRWACQGHRESRCKPCSARYRRRVGEVAVSGPKRRPGGYWYLGTLTAPGERQHVTRDGQVCPCTPPGGVDLASWNASHSRRWNHFRTALRRVYAGVEFMRGVEVQQRLALHDHFMVWSEVPIRKGVLRDLAMRAGFGHSVDLAPITSAKQVAYYVSKYVVKATDSRDEVPWRGQVVDKETGEVTEELVPARYRTWSCSRQYGDRMVDVKARARERVQAMEQAIADAAPGLLIAELGCVLVPDPDETPPSPP